MTHICIGLLTIISTSNGLSPGLHQVIFWTNAEKLLIVPLRTNLSEILIKMLTLSFKKMPFKNITCEMVAILSWSQYVDIITTKEAPML